MSRVVLENKTQPEVASEQFDFSSRLAIGESISSATVAITVYSGTDPAVADMISGAATISGAVVTQKIQGGVTGAIYQLVATIHTSASQILTMTGYLPVVPA